MPAVPACKNDGELGLGVAVALQRREETHDLASGPFFFLLFFQDQGTAERPQPKAPGTANKKFEAF